MQSFTINKIGLREKIGNMNTDRPYYCRCNNNSILIIELYFSLNHNRGTANTTALKYDASWKLHGLLKGKRDMFLHGKR